MKNDEPAVEAPEALSEPEAFANTAEHHTLIQIHEAARPAVADRSERSHPLENQTEDLNDRYPQPALRNERR